MILWRIAPGRYRCLKCGEEITTALNKASYCYPCYLAGTRIKGAAHSAVAGAIARRGLDPAKSKLCVDCGAPAHCYDHRDYDRPLDVDPVCRSCDKRRGPGKQMMAAYLAREAA